RGSTPCTIVIFSSSVMACSNKSARCSGVSERRIQGRLALLFCEAAAIGAAVTDRTRSTIAGARISIEVRTQGKVCFLYCRTVLLFSRHFETSFISGRVRCHCRNARLKCQFPCINVWHCQE